MKPTLIGAWAAFAVALAAPAWAAPATDPPPPEGLAREQVDRWVARYIDPGSDVEAAATDDMVLFYAPATVKKTEAGVEVMVRGEQFVVEIIPPGPIRSFRDLWRFDCAGRRFLLIESEIFPHSNLQGTPVRLDTADERWSGSFPEGVGPGSLIARVCRDAGVAFGGS